MVKQSLGTLVKQGIGTILAGGGVVTPTYITSKLVDLEKYLGPDLTKGYGILQIIKDVGITAAVGIGCFYFAKDMLKTYNKDLLERQFIKEQKKMKKLQKKEIKRQRYIQKKQGNLEALENELKEMQNPALQTQEA